MPLDPTQRVVEKITVDQQGDPPPPADTIGMGGRLQSECRAEIIGIRKGVITTSETVDVQV
jgi:hypothetical protein